MMFHSKLQLQNLGTITTKPADNISSQYQHIQINFGIRMYRINCRKVQFNNNWIKEFHQN